MNLQDMLHRFYREQNQISVKNATAQSCRVVVESVERQSKLTVFHSDSEKIVTIDLIKYRYIFREKIKTLIMAL